MNLLRITTIICALSVPLAAQGPDPAAPRAGVKLNAFPVQIPDGSAVVLKNGDAVGVIFVTDQLMDPEQCTFHWLLRTDGRLDFGAKDKGLQEGHKNRAKTLKFGPFEIEWSGSGDGHGWVYFPKDDTYMGVIVGAKREDLIINLPFVPMIRKVRADTIGLESLKNPK